MKKDISTERSYTIGFHSTASVGKTGVSVSVTGDSKTKVEREARELYEQAVNDCKAIEARVKNENPS